MRNVKAKSVKANNLLPISQNTSTEKKQLFSYLFKNKKAEPTKVVMEVQKTQVIDQNVKAFIKKAEKMEERLSKLLRSSDKRGSKAKVVNHKLTLEQLREMLNSLKTSYNEYKINIINQNKLLMEESARQTNELIRNVQLFIGTSVNNSLSSVRGI
ncbi:MAG: hypothetical protein WCO33_03035 [bacterium]